MCFGYRMDASLSVIPVETVVTKEDARVDVKSENELQVMKIPFHYKAPRKKRLFPQSLLAVYCCAVTSIQINKCLCEQFGLWIHWGTGEH